MNHKKIIATSKFTIEQSKNWFLPFHAFNQMNTIYIFFSYVRQADNFYDVTVLNAGHMVPTDQPINCLELIDRFIRNTL